MPPCPYRALRRAVIRATTATLLLAASAGGALAAAAVAPTVDPGTCDPSRATCVRVCSPLDAALGRCRPADPGGGAGAAPGGGGGTCSPAPGGDPGCGGAGPASQGGGAGGGVPIGGGNPIHLASGNKHQAETDLEPLPGVLGLELKRYYNSLVPHAGLAGAHWRIGYETVLYDMGRQIQIVQADGRRLMFERGAGSGATLCSSPQWQDGQVRIAAPAPGDGGPVYHWRWPDGRTLTFSGGSGGGHPLQAITAVGGQRLTLHYGPAGDLLRVRDPQGRQLVFVYAAAAQGGRLAAIDTPLGRLRYLHDAQGRLTGVVHHPGSARETTRLYHYEDRYNAGHPNALTGISVRGPGGATGTPVELRVSTFAYDASGRAVLSTKGRPREQNDGQPVADTGIEQIELEYVERALPFEGPVDRTTGEVKPRQLGRTILTNSLGQKTEVLHAVIGGQHRLVQMRGAGCAACGPTNMRYAYGRAGQLLRATRLDDDGRALVSHLIQYDAHGRVAALGRQPQPARASASAPWQRRFHYDDRHHADGTVALAAQPSRIVEASVVAGRWHELQVTYDELGRPTSLTESGYSPVDDRGELRPGGHPIQRITRLRYATIGSVSLLAEIDGPLPNGLSNSPADSDITHLHWDADGRFLAGITLPMGRRITLTHDDTAGRLVRVEGPGTQGERLQYEDDGRLASLQHTDAGAVVDGVSFEHDPLGHVVQLSSLAAGAPPVAEWRRAFDVAGRLQWEAQPLGVLRQARYDSEDHLLSALVHSGAMRQEERYAWDARGRLALVDDAQGSTHRLVHDGAGRLVAHIDPLGRLTRMDPDAQQVTEAAGTAQPLSLRRRDRAGGPATMEIDAHAGDGSVRRIVVQRWADDFGREVMSTLPDGARVLKRYDEAGRLRQWEAADGTTVDVEHDLAGHVVRRTVIPNAARGATAGGIPSRSAQPVTTRYVYDGERLVAVQHPEQDEELVHDAGGLVTGRVVSLVLASGGRVRSEQRHRYDQHGRLVGSTLPDGSELHYERDGLGAVVALHRRRIDGAPFGWGDTVVIGELERDLVGLRGARYGNGVAAQWQRSRDGVLARLAYLRPPPAAPRWRTALESWFGEAKAAAARSDAFASEPESAAPGAYGVPPDPHALWDTRVLFDAAGRVVAQAQLVPGAPPAHGRYAYDAHDQLVQAVRQAGSVTTSFAVATGTAAPPPAVWRYHHDSAGRRLLADEPARDHAEARAVAARTPGPTTSGRTDSGMDAAGRVLGDETRGYTWNAAGRLAEARLPDGAVARYRYDHRGLRIGKQVGGHVVHALHDEHGQRLADLDERGRILREYIWLADHLVAVIDFDEPRVPHAEPATLAERIGRAIASAWRLVTGGGERIAYVHTDHLGAPVAMTDRHARPVWRADYAPFGRRVAGDRPDAMRLDLRLPGQWEDEETGLHYNEQRYYDPDRGRYLSPDPLGLAGGLDAYAYVGNNPLGFVDPHGLLLFAFDGTGNDETNPDRWSNVVRFRNLYVDDTRYVTGPGTRDPASGIDNPWYNGGEPLDIASSLTGMARIGWLVGALNLYADRAADDVALDIDVIGFSRGAAEARDFANRITHASRHGYYGYEGADGKPHCQRVAFRFMGLWDSVLSTHTGSYQLDIPDDFSYVAQAVALNEYRSLFSLESIRGRPAPAAQTRIERGFLGAHSDIGGSFADGQLARVALVWMVDQATAAGVAMREPPRTLIASPVLHDKSSNLHREGGPSPDIYSEDRVIRYRDGRAERERGATIPGMSYSDTAQFIRYDDNPRGMVAGHVDMSAYLAWLDANGYALHMGVQ